MSELGQLLRKARQEKGISLDELQETTKIRKRYLEAIEEGNFKILPGNFYVRAFVKSYAEAIGLDPNEVLALYSKTIPASAVEPKTEPMIRKRSISKLSDRKSKLATTLMLVCFFLLIVGIIYYYISKNDKAPEQSNPIETIGDGKNRLTEKTAPPSQTPSPSDASPAIQTTPQPAAPITSEVKLVSTENGTDYYQISKTAKLSLEMSVTSNDCWFEIDKVSKESNKKDMLEQGTLATGSAPRTWTFEHPVFIILGRANAATLKINGTIIPVGDSPNVKRFQFELLPS